MQLEVRGSLDATPLELDIVLVIVIVITLVVVVANILDVLPKIPGLYEVPELKY